MSSTSRGSVAASAAAGHAATPAAIAVAPRKRRRDSAVGDDCGVCKRVSFFRMHSSELFMRAQRYARAMPDEPRLWLRYQRAGIRTVHLVCVAGGESEV